MSGAMKERLRLRLTRLVLHAYPIHKGKARLERMLVPEDVSIPLGTVVRVKSGLRFRLYPGGMHNQLYLWGAYEPLQTSIYRTLLRPGDVAFDIGTHFGWYAAHFGRWVSPGGQVHAFEPMPTFFERAQDAVCLNDVADSVVLNNVGLGAEEGSFTVHTFAGLRDGHASASDLGRSDATAHTCRITTLDGYTRDHGIERIDFLKCDVEGFEREVFLGGREVLSRPDAPLISFEVNMDCLSHRGIQARQVQQTLRELGYTDFLLTSQSGWLGSKVRPVEGPIAERSADYLACKSCHADRLRASGMR